MFALAHIPALISAGATASEFISLLADCGLGILVLGTVWRSRDILWFWLVHFFMDMTQFSG